MHTKVLIVEDSLLDIWNMEQMFQELRNYEILANFQDADSALQFIDTNNSKIDLAIVDICLEGTKNGIELARSITARKFPIIFVTQDKNESIYHETSNIPNHSFLVKPFHKHTLDSFIKTLLGKTTKVPEKESLIYVKVGDKRHVIAPEDIIWIESNKNYCTIYTNNNHYVVKRALKNIYSFLPVGMFIFIHKSFLVQLSKITRIDLKGKHVLLGKATLPLGRNYIKSLRQHLINIG